MRYKLAIFDLDGTLLDTLEDLMNSVNHALAAHGFPARTYREVRRIVGHGIRNLIEQAVPEGTAKEDVDRVFAAFKAHYTAHCADLTRPYPGVCELLGKLRARGVKIGVISNKADPAVQELMKVYFDGLVDQARGEVPGVPKKPAPDGVLLMTAAFGCRPSEAVYVGDSEVDVETAVNSGLDQIIVTWGFRDRDVLERAGANVFADCVGDVYALITG